MQINVHSDHNYRTIVFIQGACISFDQQIAYYSTVYGVIVQQLGTAGAQDHLSKSVFAIVIGSNELLNYAKSNSASKPTPKQFVDSFIPTLQGQLKVLFDLYPLRYLLTRRIILMKDFKYMRNINKNLNSTMKDLTNNNKK
jgi:hypothetical protein